MSKSKSGPSMTPEGTALYHIIERCTDPTNRMFKHYGGRGIGVCEEWLLGRPGASKYQAFIEDMGRKPSPAHTIERIDNDGNYEPRNCRWATRAEQAQNKRNNVRLTCGGETRVLAEWARVSGVPEWTIRRRLKRGWSIDLALERPDVRPCA